MNEQKTIALRTERRKYRVRNRLKRQRSDRLRVSVSRSLNNIYAQIIDDRHHKTLASFSSLQLGKKTGDKKKIAHQVGIELGKKAVDLSVDTIFFDRGCHQYHGRVKALAEGAREGGLKEL